MLRVRNNGVPIVGFTWYWLTDQIDWDSGLRENHGRINALGLASLERELRPVGHAYRDLIRDWSAVLPTQSVCLQVPVALSQDYPQLDAPAAAPEADPAATTGAPKNAESPAACRRFSGDLVLLG